MQKLSIILPAHNEAENLKTLLPILIEHFPHAEICVVNDGSTDDTQAVLAQFPVRPIHRPYNQGNGAAIKTGARMATGERLVLMDADGQHPVEKIQVLLAALDEGYDMAVGARSRDSQANRFRAFANGFYNVIASLVVSHPILDLTSGFRAVDAEKFKGFLHLLPNGFSYPSTITMAFFRAGFAVKYIPFKGAARQGKSHIKPIRDGMRFLLIIYKVATLYSPLKVFAPIGFVLFLLGLFYLMLQTYLGSDSGFTAALFLSTAFVIFLMGLISEQITVLMYKDE